MEKFLRDHAHGRRARGLLRAATPSDSIDAPARGARGQRDGGLTMPAVALIGTLDTKGDEIAYVRERLIALRRRRRS